MCHRELVNSAGVVPPEYITLITYLEKATNMTLSHLRIYYSDTIKSGHLNKVSLPKMGTHVRKVNHWQQADLSIIANQTACQWRSLPPSVPISDVTSSVKHVQMWTIDAIKCYNAMTDWMLWQFECFDSLTALTAWMLWQLECFDSLNALTA